MEEKEKLLEDVKLFCKNEFIDFIYSMLIEPLQILSYEDNNIILVSPSDAQKTMITSEHLEFLTNTFSLLTKKKINLIIIDEKEREHYENIKNDAEEANKNFPQYDITNLNPNYTLDKFVVGESNKLAYATAQAVVSPSDKNQTISYNPLFIYGGPGLGKTHLMHGIGNSLYLQNNSLKIIYVTAEQFLNELVTSIKEKSQKSEIFRKKYRNIDVFIMDDVQFLSGKEAAQLELYNTFNELYQNKKRIILSADKPPKDIPILEERLKSRFNWGIIVDISRPDYETRLAILRKKSEEKNIIIDNHILAIIAEKINTNIRDLEGVLNKVIVISSLTKTPITIDIVEKAINEIAIQKEQELTPEHIINVVANYFNVNNKDILSSKKSSNIVFPRQIAMYLCRNVLNLPYQKISALFNKKDHTTVMHAEQKIEKDIQLNNQTKLIVESVENILKNSNSL